MDPRIPLPAVSPPWLPEFAGWIEYWLREASRRPISGTPVTATATLSAADGVILVNAASGAVTLNLPAAASVTGLILTAKKIDASGNAVVLDGNGTETIDGATTKSITTQWASLTIQSNGTAWFII